MKLGLIRHFEVDARPAKEGMNTSDYLKWIDIYDASDVLKCDVDMKDIDWNVCYSSDMKRAYLTAEEIYDGDIISTHLLREVKMQPVIDTEEKKPYKFWKDSGNEAWKLEDISQLETMEDTRRRVNSFLDFIEHKEDKDARILVVSHIVIMRVFEEELKRRAYKGEYTEDPLNGKIYLFEK